MDKVTLDDFMAFNDQLAALAETGAPLNLGLGRSPSETAEALERINASVARRVSRGDTLEEAVEHHEPPLPAAYRSLIGLGLRSSNLPAGLDIAGRLAATVDHSRYSVRAAFFYPLVVCCLAVSGLIGFCLWIVPTLQHLHAGMRLPTGRGFGILRFVSDALPYWAFLLPLVLVVTAWQFRTSTRAPATGREKPSLWRRFSVMSRAEFQQRCATFAASLAALLAADVPLAESLRLAAGASGDERLANAARELAAALEEGRPTDPPQADSARREPRGRTTAANFPPFLRWAIVHSETTVGRPQALRMAADVYGASAERTAEHARLVVPIAACIVLGGGVTLLYGLALFVPVVEMIQELAFHA